MGLFLYGTLLHPRVFELVAGPGGGTMQEATLANHAVLRVKDSELPMLVPQAGGIAKGQFCSGLSAAQIARLDAYEIPFGYHPKTLVVRLSDGREVEAQVYEPPADQHPTHEPWSIHRWEAAWGEMTIEANTELASYEPPLTADELSARWEMIWHRAEARVRGRHTPAPSDVRAGHLSADISGKSTSGDFFRFRQVELNHRRYDGAMTGPLRREAFIGVDAALVLPYDPLTDRVLLVEQVRVGPLLRADANPHMLEPVAGIIDVLETPVEAALRETEEEAGLSEIELQPMFAFYPSPGASTDYFHCFIGLADLGDERSYTGGVADEHEDLRVHILSRERALALIDSGEIATGPLITMLLWLDRNRLSLGRMG